MLRGRTIRSVTVDAVSGLTPDFTRRWYSQPPPWSTCAAAIWLAWSSTPEFPEDDAVEVVVVVLDDATRACTGARRAAVTAGILSRFTPYDHTRPNTRCRPPQRPPVRLHPGRGDAHGLDDRRDHGVHRHPGRPARTGGGPQDLPQEAGPLRRTRRDHHDRARRHRLPPLGIGGEHPLLVDRPLAAGCVRRRLERPGCRPLVQPGPAPDTALRVRRPRPHPGHRLLLRAPRRRRPRLARRLPPPDHGGHPDPPRARPARPWHGHDHGDRAAHHAGGGGAPGPHP